MSQIVIKGASGLGDAVYLYPIVNHYLKHNDVIVKTKYPEVFLDMENYGNTLMTIDYDDKIKPDIDCSYVNRKHITETTQFQDMCINAGIPDIELEMDFCKRKTALVCNPYNPMNNAIDRKELLPDMDVYSKMIESIPDEFNVIMYGMPNKYNIKHDRIDLDLTGATSIKELFILFRDADFILSQIGNSIAIAEAFNKNIFVLFAESGLKSTNKFFNTITPKKVITKETSKYCIDTDIDCVEQFERFIDAIC